GSRRPERRERAVGGAGGGIFVDAALRREKARDEISVGARAYGGDDDAARGNGRDEREIGFQRFDDRVAFDFHEQIGSVVADEKRPCSERLRESWRRLSFCSRSGGEIQLDAIAVALCGAQSAARVEARDRVHVEKAFLPKR